MLTKGNVMGLIEAFSNDGSSAQVPIATNSVAGIVKIGSGIIVSADGTITVSTSGVQGTWNANTNTPTIPTASASNKGWYYIVSVAGTTSINGINSWAIGDWILSDGTKWTKIPNTTIIATTSSAGEIIVGKGLNVDGTGLTTVKIGTGLKFDASNNILVDTANIDVTQLKNFSSLVTGKPKGFFNNTATLSTFANCSKGDFYIYNGTSSFTLGGYTFNTGDQLWCITTFMGTPTDLTTNFTYVANTVLQATTTSLGTVKLGSATPLMDSSTASVGASMAMAREDHIHPQDSTKITKVSSATANDVAILKADGSISDSGILSTNLITLTGTQTLINKTINATNNTISNLDTTMFASGIIDTDGTLTSNSDTKIASEKAVKTYVDSKAVSISGTSGNVISIGTDGKTPVDSGILKSSLVTGSGTNGQVAQFNGTNTITSVSENTAFNQNFETTTTNIKMNGTQSVGSSSNIARADHVHPSDTAKVDKVSTTVANDFITFSNVTGSIQDSGLKLSTDGTMADNSDLEIPSQKAVKTYIDSKTGATAIKNNLIATTDPIATSDSSAGYSAGSIWINTNTSITWTCQSATNGNAVWLSDTNTLYYDTWSSLVTALTNATSSHVGKYCIVNNANGGAISGATYKSTDTLTNTINDGGSATYYVSADYYSTTSVYYTVVCQNRTTLSSQLVISGIYTNTTTASTVVTSLGATNTFYAIWTSVASADTSTITKNAIMKYNGSTWSLYQSFDNAPEIVMVGSTGNWNPYCKTNGTWTNYGINSTALAYGYYGINDTIGLQSLTASVWTRASGTATAIVSNNITNTAGSYKFTITQAGTYEISSASTLHAIGATAWVQSAIYKNGTSLISTKAYVSTAGSAETCSTSYVGTFTVGDYIELYSYLGTAGYFNGGYLSVKQLPTATYIPASASIPTALAYGNASAVVASLTAYYANAYAISAGTWTTVTCGAVVNNATNITGLNGTLQFTITQAGNYKVGAGSTIVATSGPDWYSTGIAKNGTILNYSPESWVSQGSSGGSTEIEYIGTFAVGDIITCKAYSQNVGFIQGGYLTVEQLPVATYVPANSLTPTTLNWLKLGGTASYTTTSGGAMALPLTSQQGSDLSYNSSTGVTKFNKTSNYKITCKPGSGTYTSLGAMILQISLDNGTTWSAIYTAFPESPTATYTNYSPQEIHWEGSLSLGTYIRIVTNGGGVQGGTADVTTYPAIYIEEIPSATVISPNSVSVSDNTTNGYYDIGSMRIQFGVAPNSTYNKTITLPAPFANSNYSVTANFNNPNEILMSINITSKSTTTFSSKGFYVISGSSTVSQAGDPYNWVAIGLR